MSEVENKRKVMGELVQAGAQLLSKFCQVRSAAVVVVVVVVCQLSPSPPQLCQLSPSRQPIQNCIGSWENHSSIGCFSSLDIEDSPRKYAKLSLFQKDIL